MEFPIGDFLPDRPVLKNAATEALNVIPYAGRYLQFRNLASVSDALAAQPVGAFSTSVVDGTAEVYAGTDVRLYRLSGTTWDDISKGATDYSTSSPSRWEFAQFDDDVYAANRANTLQTTDIAGGNDFADVTSGPKAAHIGVVRDFVVVGNIDDATDGVVESRIRWSAIGDPSDWPTPGTSDAFAKQSDEQTLPTRYGGVQAIIGTEYGIVVQRKAVSRMDYVGSPLVFSITQIDATRGAITPGSVTSVGRRVFFLSDDGFYMNDGSGESVPIGDGKIDKWFLSMVDADNLQKMKAAADPINKLIVWAFPIIDGSDVACKLLFYNYAEDRWSHAEQEVAELLSNQQPGYSLEDLDSFGTLETIETSFDDPFWGPGAISLGAINDDFKLCTFSGSARDAVVETGEFGQPGVRTYLNGVRPLVTGDGTITLQVAARNRQDEDPTWTNAVSVTNATGRADFRSSAFFHRVRINVSGGFTDLIGVDDVVLRADGGR